MKKILLLVIALCFSSQALTQNEDKNVNVRIEGVRAGDSTYYKKITTTTIGDKVKVEEEILSSSYVKNEKESFRENEAKKNSSASIIAMNLIFSTLSDNTKLNSLLNMKEINNVNLGGNFSLGGRLRFGMEIMGVFGVESIINKTNNKKLHSVSALSTLTFGYPFRIKKDKYMFVPYLGFGYNAIKFQYSQTYNRAINFEELKESSWTVFSHNLYIPLGIEFRYRLLPVSFLIIGAEYRLNFYHSGALLPNTLQKVYDFPKFTINNLAIKIGLIGIFNKH